ncbi:MAG TPA: dTMP kinase, partial [Candidatus Saccharimonadales bacterium]
MPRTGKYIVIEGPEGVGKSTQVMELGRRLAAANLPYRLLREPDSQSDLTARAIRQLTQDPRYPMNTRTEVLLYNAARSQSLQIIQQSIEQGIICVVDRNYLTTLAVQYYGRGDVPDYQVINNIINFAVGGVEPDLCIVLDAPAQTLKKRTTDRKQGERFDNLEIEMLDRIRAGYLWEANQRHFPIVFATEGADKVADKIWQHVAETLAIRGSKSLTAASQPTSVAEIISETKVIAEPKVQEAVQQQQKKLLIKNEDGSYEITQEGNEYLDRVVTNVSGNVYAFNTELSPVTIAAAMARLSRRGDDMRITLLDEFAENEKQDQKLLERVITAYGDDSVQQLGGIHFVVENASNL